MLKRFSARLGWLLVSVAAACLSVAALAQGPVEPGKGPPECPGIPGAFVAGQAQDLKASGTPPGQAVKPLARSGKGVGDEARNALRGECGIGALPQPEPAD